MLLPNATQATASSSLAVVVAVVPDDLALTALPASSVLAILSRIGEEMPVHSSIYKFAPAPPASVNDTSVGSDAPAILYHIDANPFPVPSTPEVALVNPAIAALEIPAVDEVQLNHAMSRFPCVGVDANDEVPDVVPNPGAGGP